MKIANKHVGKKLTSLLIIKYKLKQLLQCYAILICKIKKNEKPNADDSLGNILIKTIELPEKTHKCTIPNFSYNFISFQNFKGLPMDVLFLQPIKNYLPRYSV